MLPLQAWLRMAPHVVVGPTVEAAVLHVGDVVGDKIVAQTVTLVHRTPQFAGSWIDRQSPAWVADAVGVYPEVGTIGIHDQNVGAVFLLGVRVGVIDVRRRADGNK